jgi:predicted component of type VI protein secretion system
MQRLLSVLALVLLTNLFVGCASSDQARSESAQVRVAFAADDEPEVSPWVEAGWTIGSSTADRP